MKKYILLILILFLYSCSQKQYQYKGIIKNIDHHIVTDSWSDTYKIYRIIKTDLGAIIPEGKYKFKNDPMTNDAVYTKIGFNSYVIFKKK